MKVRITGYNQWRKHVVEYVTIPEDRTPIQTKTIWKALSGEGTNE